MQSVNASLSPEVQMNENFATLAILSVFGKRQPGVSGLTWAYYGGIYNGNSVADGPVSLTNGATNYVVALRSSGVVSASTSLTNWNSLLYARLYKLVTAGGVVTTEEDHRFDSNGLFGQAARWVPVACGDETTAITTGVKVTFRWQGAFQLLAIRGSLTTAQASGSLLTVDVKKNGTTVFSTLLTFDNTEKTSLTAATACALTATPLAIADDDEITIEVTQVGASTVAAGLKLYFQGAQG